ncbi:MAG: DUF6089 family protein [Ferruginibacter sp.]
MLRIFFILIFSAASFIIQAQNLHFTVFAGLGNYQGDLQARRITMKNAQAAFGGGVLYGITEKLFARGLITYGKVKAHDKDGGSNQYRNLSFSSPILEGQLGLEYDIFNLNNTVGITPYFFAGVAFYHFNPSSIDEEGAKVELQPLGTEGQGFYLGRKKYSLTQLSIPVGGGLKLAVNENIYIRFEAGLRKLFTDYLDDVSTTYADQQELLAYSGQKAVEMAFRTDELGQGAVYPVAGAQRGNPKSKDWYYFGTVGLSFRIQSGDGYGSGSGKKSGLGCPVNVY